MNAISSQNDIKASILYIEEKYPVDLWEVNGIKVWPYIRIKLYIHFLMMMNKSIDRETKQKKDVVEKKRNLLNLFLELIISFVKLNLFFFKLNKKKYLLFGSHIQRVKQNGLYFNRFYDALSDLYGLQEEVYMMEFQKVYTNSYNKGAIITLEKNIHYYKNIQKVVSKFKKNSDVSNLPDYKLFYEYLKKIPVRLDLLKIGEKDLLKWTNKIHFIKPFFKRFYKKVQPNTISFLGFYGYDDLYAALLTANQNGIKTVDFQHGPQTNIHMVYSSWTKFPKEGYDLMPKEFWNWDEFSKENIESWSKKAAKIKTKVVGQPFVNYWLKHNSFENKTNNNILYSLQTFPFEIQDMITPKIIQLIKELPYQWILRLHPRNYLKIDGIQVFLDNNNISDKTIIQSSIDSPLPEVILNSIAHVTNFSGCLIEAHLLGKPTIIINNIGKEMFAQYLDNKSVFYLEQKNIDFELNFKNKISFIKKNKNITINKNFLNPFEY